MNLGIETETLEFKRSKDIESFGTGLRRIAEACEKVGVLYEFQKKKTGFVVCFYRMADDEKPKNLDKVWISTDNLTISERKVVEYLAQNEQVTNRQIQELLGVKDSRALKVLHA